MKKRFLRSVLRDSLLRRLACVVAALLMSVTAAFAHDGADTVYTFRFWRASTKLFVPAFGNDAELARLEECVGRHIEDILAGRMPLYVDGYCNSRRTVEDNLAVARGRSNRVKAELITRRGLREEHFVTDNHASEGDFVVVRLFAGAATAAAETGAAAGTATAAAETRPATDVTGTGAAERQTAATAGAAETQAAETAAARTAGAAAGTTAAAWENRLFLRANMLRWATLTPDLGVEWRIDDRWAVMVSGSWTTWSWNGKERRYALREIAPEIRYSLGNWNRGGYLGIQYKAGSFNYKFSQTGKQGDIMGGGITGGYVLRLNNTLSLDFSLGLGYIHAGYDEYVLMDGVRVRSGKGSRNWWGPTDIGVSLVWNVFNK